jgi:hypothetical protein
MLYQASFRGVSSIVRFSSSRFSRPLPVFTRSYASRTFVPDELILCSGLMHIVSTEVGSLTSYYVIIRISQTIPP